jgi:hypothetical protein
MFICYIQSPQSSNNMADREVFLGCLQQHLSQGLRPEVWQDFVGGLRTKLIKVPGLLFIVELSCERVLYDLRILGLQCSNCFAFRSTCLGFPIYLFVSIADAAKCDTAATMWLLLPTFHSSDPWRLSVAAASKRGASPGHTCKSHIPFSSLASAFLIVLLSTRASQWRFPCWCPSSRAHPMHMEGF